MKRPQLEHVLRAAARIVNRPDFLVVGSAAILATYDEAMLPVEATRSDEADLAWSPARASAAQTDAIAVILRQSCAHGTTHERRRGLTNRSWRTSSCGRGVWAGRAPPQAW